MPTYEYECGNCRHRFELRQSFDDEPEALCPQCRQAARRIFHPAPIIYKTGGFYVTDSRHKSEPLAKKGKPETPKSPEGK
jgi:putative FmdB family regulatory protein